MDNSEALERLKNQILGYRELEPDNGYESNVTAIANAILDLAGKTFSRGYIVKDECIMKSIRCDTIGIYRDKKADKAVFKERSRPMRGQINPNEEPLLVIECKHYTSKDAGFLDTDRNQLRQYMFAAEFPNGILLSEYKLEVYQYSKQGTTVAISEIEDKRIDDISNNLSEIIAIVSAF